MPISYASAIDEVCGMVNAVWNSGSAAIVGYVPEIRWPGNPKAAQVPMDKFWARVAHQVVTSEQSSLSDQYGTKRYHTIALLYVQIFCPRTASDPLSKGTALAELVRTRFRQRGISGVVWFRDQKVTRLPETSENYPINVVVTFEFDTVESNTAMTPVLSLADLVRFGLTKHLPVEVPNGIIQTFTFLNLPDVFVLVWNGLIQDSFARLGDQLTVDMPVEIGAEFYVLYYDTGVPMPASIILQHSVTLNDEQIKALPTTTVELVPALPGKVLFFEKAIFKLDATAGAYANVDANLLFAVENDADGAADIVSALMEPMYNFLVDQAKKLFCAGPNANIIPAIDSVVESDFYSNPAWDGKPLKLYANNHGGGNFTGGDPANKLTIIVYYSVIPSSILDA